jgi:uroporphyrinogen-III synthase
MGGARVAVLESRMNRELARLIERYGGEPLSTPALREVGAANDETIGRAVDALSSGSVDAVILLTGVSVTRMVEGAERMGRRAELLAGLKRVTTICRGPKPVAALRAVSVAASVCAREPYTTAEILDAIAPLHGTHERFLLVHYGERNGTLAETLVARDAIVDEVFLYTWEPPEDLAPLRDLVCQLVAGKIDALVFTCQIQLTHLLRVADESRQRRELIEALNQRVTVAAVGPRCRAALLGVGVEPKVVPENPKLGPMVAALARHLEREPPSHLAHQRITTQGVESHDEQEPRHD